MAKFDSSSLAREKEIWYQPKTYADHSNNFAIGEN